MNLIYKNAKTLLLSCIIFGTFTVGCKRDQEQLVPVSEEAPRMLSFVSFKEFNDTANKFLSMTASQQEEWEKKEEFTSLRQLFNKVQREEEVNYERENKLYESNSLLVGSHQRSETAKQMMKMLIFNDTEGGVQLNVSEPRFSPLLNKDGMVRIANQLWQFTYYQTKTIVIGGKIKEDIASLMDAQQTQEDKLLFVNAVSHKIHPIGLPNNANAKLMYNQSCDITNGSQYRMIGYVDEVEGSGRSQCDQNGVCYPDPAVEYRYSSLVVTVRTLKRGAFGGWYNRDSGLQASSGSVKISGTIPQSNEWVSHLGSGVRPWNPYLSHSFYINNNGGSSATWQFYVFAGQPSDFTNPQSATSNVRYDSGTQINLDWNGDYNCHCTINY